MDAHTIICSAIALFTLWVAIFYLWRDYRYDSFREDIFSIRDELFIYAAGGSIEFGNPAYCILRDRMNSLLRHGHDLTLTRLIILVCCHDGVETEYATRWADAIQMLSEETRKKLMMYDSRVAIFVLQNVIYSSFFRYLLIRPFVSGVKIHEVVQSPKIASGVQRLERETIKEDEEMLRELVSA